MFTPVHKITTAPLILIVCDVIFCMLEKHIIDNFSRFFKASTFLTPELLFTVLKTISGVNKVLAPSQNPSKSPIMCFARIKK